MKIYLAMIEHDYGVNLYAAATEQELEDKIFSFVEMWWPAEDLGPIPENKGEAIQIYFDDNPDERVIWDEDHMDAAESYRDIRNDFWSELELVLSDISGAAWDAIEAKFDALRDSEVAHYLDRFNRHVYGYDSDAAYWFVKKFIADELKIDLDEYEDEADGEPG